MLILRLLAFLVVLTVGASAVVYLLTGNRRYLRFGMQVFKYGLIVGALIVAFIFLERLVLAI
ncbi:MAG TPA: hypothetical protein VKZ48_05150 [Burkholderiales bacterium]|nr:hypothetical protein [Burkholderiales bacterium]